MNMDINKFSMEKRFLKSIKILLLLLMCSTNAMAAEGDNTTADNQSQRVVTFKAVPETERLFILANSIMELIKKTALLNISYQ